MKVKDRIQLLIEILESSKINTLEVSSFWGFRKIKLSKKEEKIITPDTKASSNSVSDNLKPKTDQSTFNLPQKLKQLYGHSDLGVYILPLQDGEISCGDQVKF